ncbi:phytanoyl-CoA dioxygenase family protein [Catenulispora pinisilvae]|uniref:phytanoyl-CoA dioxygenase family protein n=1 Tax=Catenulispora pinisilvae TaxID=2705253 RepID=UPI001890FB81|nr:phytanoyl-CoA dioxygenase family protein [Catenulispora pinisilvae]
MGVDVEGFIKDGYVVVRGAFDQATAAHCRELIWAELHGRGIGEDQPTAWPAHSHIDSLDGEPFTAAAGAPALTTAYDELIGAGRWTRGIDAGRAVSVRFPSPERANSGYHIEGSYGAAGGPYRCNVRSRGRGLLALLLFGDVGPQDAPTRLVSGSHLYVPEFLAPYGEDGTVSDGCYWRPSVLCRPVVHATGQAGDVFLCHPFIVHTATWPHTGTAPRMIAQPAVHVRDGFAIDGSDSAPVARAIVAGLEMAAQA